MVWVAYLFQPSDRRVGDAAIQLGENPKFLFGKPWGANFGIYIKHSKIPALNKQTSLLVTKFVFGDGQTDAWLWINPELGEKPQETEAQIRQTASFRPTERLSIKLQGYGRGIYLVDEIRIGPTFPSVTPQMSQTR